MPWTISKSFRFAAAHHLPNHDGKCSRQHGHNYRLTVTVQRETLHPDGPKAGMGIDFADLAAAVKPLLDQYLDHRDLNKTLGVEHPTAEILARWVYQRLRESLPGLAAVRVDETEDCSAEYREERP